MRFLFPAINTHILYTPPQAYQISVSKNQISICGEYFYLIFMVSHENSLKNIGDEYFELFYRDM